MQCTRNDNTFTRATSNPIGMSGGNKFKQSSYILCRTRICTQPNTLLTTFSMLAHGSTMVVYDTRFSCCAVVVCLENVFMCVL